MKSAGRWAQALGGLALGLVLCWGLIRGLDIQDQDALRLIEGLSWPWTIAATLLTALHWWSGAHKWALWDEALHGEKGREPTEGFFRRHFAWQNWLGQFVPPTLAIVLGRSWFSRHQAGIGWRGGAGSGVYDQGMEFILLAGLLPASWLALEHSASRLVITLAALAGLLGAGGTIFLGRKYLPRLNPSFLLPLLLWSALRVVLTVARLATGVLALGLSLNLINVMAASPVVTLLALLPLTPGNLGLAEWGWVGVLKFAGEDATAAALYALGFRLLMLAAQSLLLAAQEGLFFILKKRKIQAA